jgi:hypothetical protein
MDNVEKCPVIVAECEHYAYQYDRNGDVVIVFCSHPDNPNKYEGNCLYSLCPIAKEDEPDGN